MKVWLGVLWVVGGVWAAGLTAKEPTSAVASARKKPALHLNQMTRHKATGTPRFMTFAKDPITAVGAKTPAPEIWAQRFLQTYGTLYGLSDANAQLEAQPAQRDPYGFTHLQFRQHHHGIPVFGARLNMHFNPAGKAAAVNGTLIPTPDLSLDPRIMPNDAAYRALQAFEREHQTNDVAAIVIDEPELMFYRRNLERGIADDTFLVWRVAAGHVAAAQEDLFIDAHSGKLVDRLPTRLPFLNRSVYNGPIGDRFLAWSEGDALPYRGHYPETVNNLIAASGHTYHLFAALSQGQYLSYDGNGGHMINQFNAPFTGCPNAFWDGSRSTFCPGFAIDDVIAHEWTHAYSMNLHNLIYRWQSGALNEAYSDIFGEAVDQLNQIGLDEPSGPRSDNGISIFRQAPALLDITHPRELLGSYPASAGKFGKTLAQHAFDGDLAIVRDRSFVPEAGCLTIENPNEVRGKIALMRRSTCDMGLQAYNAQKAGALAVVFYNNAGDLTETFGTRYDFDIDIPVIMVGWSQGLALREALDRGRVNVAMRIHNGDRDNTYRWLQGEELQHGFGRDMWTPTAMGHPGKVSDKEYFCNRGDAGGVHFNSSIPNHAFALLVDGGTYNGVTVRGIGLQKALHIYWRAMRYYQVPDTDFADHADALMQSAHDLIGHALTPLTVSATNYQTTNDTRIDADDVAQVDRAMTAVEMRDVAHQCDFLTIMEPDLTGLCPLATMETLFTEDFETDTDAWETQTASLGAAGEEASWRQVDQLPDGRRGKAMFVPNGITTDCRVLDQAGVTSLISPSFTVPTLAEGDELVLFLDHYLALEWNWDGANIKFQRNNGAWQEIAYERGIHNGYNGLIIEERYGNINPMAGQIAWYGTTDGTNNESIWAQTQLSLTGLLQSGDQVRLRFDLGTDACGGALGWYLDTVRLLRCSPGEAPRPQATTWIPHVSARQGGYKTVLHLENLGTTDQRVTLLPYTDNGEALPTRTLILSNGADYRTLASTLFEQDAVSHLALQHDATVKIGAAYRPHFSKIESTPLAATGHTAKRFHYAPDHSRFEAVTLVNPTDLPTRVVLKAYNESGALVSEEVLSEALAPHAKQMLPLSTRLSTEVTHFTLSSDSPLIAAILALTGVDGSLSPQNWLPNQADQDP